ncbi:hypothetical protein Scep_007388 [Stephania cephalantha]|uniref:Uncharacterized protein n=1 Tax=Stephania cephalantha TaxID=152367 RepID=A0AAP0PQ00_9MAGN
MTRQVYSCDANLMNCKNVTCKRHRNLNNHPHIQVESDVGGFKIEGYHPGLEDFQSVLSTFTRYKSYDNFIPCTSEACAADPSSRSLAFHHNSFDFLYEAV